MRRIRTDWRVCIHTSSPRLRGNEVTEPLLILAGVSMFAALVYAAYLDPTTTALRALHQALERGDISPNEYASHLSALEQSV